MGKKICVCNSGNDNTGKGCTGVPSVAIKVIAMRQKKKDGSLNGINFATEADANGIIPDSVIQDHLNDPIPENRWYPIGDFENVEDLRAEPISQSFNSGNSIKIKDGVRSFTGLIPEADASFEGVLNTFGCIEDLAVMYVDDAGNLIGESLDKNFLRPIKVDKATWNATYIVPTDTEAVGVSLSYNYSQTVSDANRAMIGANGFETDLVSISGLKDASLAIDDSSISTTVVKFVATADYGSSINDTIKIKDLVEGDLVFNNETQSAVITLVSFDVSNAGSGEYTATYAAQTAADVIRIDTTKIGYEFDSVKYTIV